ncbi:MAG: hypothetical protein WC046_09925, partial [Candidatus Bathyarchaeia archaeon]
GGLKILWRRPSWVQVPPPPTFALGTLDWNLLVQTDFRVQAVVGYEYVVWSLGGGITPIDTQFKLLEASSWSNTQTVTSGLPSLIVLALLVIAIVGVLVTTALFVLRRHRKTAYLKQ